MRYSIQSLLKPSTFIGLLALLCCFSNCKDSIQGELDTPFAYDSSKHIYGKSYAVFSSGETWELIIDPQSGAYAAIPGTKGQGTPPYPVGTRDLIDFEGNKRVFLSVKDRHLVAQNLETLESTVVPIKDELTNTTSFNPQFFTFGTTNNFVYVYDVHDTLWLIDIEMGTAEIIHEDILPSGYQMDYQLYLKSRNTLVFGAHFNLIGSHHSTHVFTLDLDTGQIQLLSEIPKSFGWVLNPKDQHIYCISSPNDEQGFRLMQYKILDNDIQINTISNEDLDIDNLFFHTQTIHSASNTYICVGGSSHESHLSNNLYSIDLSNSEIVKTISINELNGYPINLVSLNAE